MSPVPQPEREDIAYQPQTGKRLTSSWYILKPKHSLSAWSIPIMRELFRYAPR
jgi:hypothetical protein